MNNRIQNFLGMTCTIFFLSMHADASFSEDNESLKNEDKTLPSTKEKLPEEQHKLYSDLESADFYVKITLLDPKSTKDYDEQHNLYRRLIATNDATVSSFKEKVKNMDSSQDQLNYIATRNFVILPMIYQAGSSGDQFITIREEGLAKTKPSQSVTSSYLLQNGDLVRFAIETAKTPFMIEGRNLIKPFANFEFVNGKKTTNFGTYCYTIDNLWGNKFSTEWNLK